MATEFVSTGGWVRVQGRVKLDFIITFTPPTSNEGTYTKYKQKSPPLLFSDPHRHLLQTHNSPASLSTYGETNREGKKRKLITTRTLRAYKHTNTAQAHNTEGAANKRTDFKLTLSRSLLHSVLCLLKPGAGNH